MFYTEVGSLEGLYSDGQSTQITKLKLAAFENQRKLKLVEAKTQMIQ
jgi:flagellar hook protein FlgE